MRARIRETKTLMNAEQQQQRQHDATTTASSLVDTLSLLSSDPVISDNKD